MRKLIPIAVFALFVACSQTSNFGDFSDLPAGAIIDSYPGSEDLKLATVYSGMYPVEQGDYYRGLRHGSWTVYYPNTYNVNTIATYVEGKKQGIFVRLNMTGGLEEQLYYHNDQLHGKYIKMRGGQVEEERTYHMGKLNGLVIKYYPGGGRMEESPYANGVIHGLARWYDQEGNLSIEYLYEQGKLVKEEE